MMMHQVCACGTHNRKNHPPESRKVEVARKKKFRKHSYKLTARKKRKTARDKRVFYFLEKQSKTYEKVAQLKRKKTR